MDTRTPLKQLTQRLEKAKTHAEAQRILHEGRIQYTEGAISRSQRQSLVDLFHWKMDNNHLMRSS